MPDLIALKSMSYATRRLQAGDTFPASRRDARVLVAIRKAEYVTADAVPEEPEPVTDAASDPLDHDGDGRKGGSKPGRRKASRSE